ncbi:MULTISPECIES: Rrf2 family transcriptional regulator [unclassified Methylobacterium]|jgi:Rrf2 family nitric oxide-sensitive transcriptional repressor|uniref:RrF2 family transcriptional regulator n=1 Tax=unclassified Methylobacterium TaxID=2615210 RepID=UPI0006FDDD61|nr:MULTISPECIES: Rrf2 family transcriptional regulator [unclassified Methylobacterium]KQO64344.1 Rrf2 family transcriptional regulator [Methylobacterium sp. Leaf88]KQT78597.1 Rrf2 family transcriptional regulator [Methylobacterium sp. Leaf465]
MRLTLHTDYALRTLIYLGVNGERRSSTAEIARAYRISESHLTKVVHKLGQLGLIRTMRGRGGGLRLGRPAAEICLGTVVRATEEDFALVACFSGAACVLTPSCRLQQVLGDALNAFLAVLDQVTLADLIGGSGGAVAQLLGLEAPRTQTPL